jgi:hypothetical protein
MACIPKEILGQAKDVARYEGSPAELSEVFLSWAWRNHFAHD